MKRYDKTHTLFQSGYLLHVVAPKEYVLKKTFHKENVLFVKKKSSFSDLDVRMLGPEYQQKCVYLIFGNLIFKSKPCTIKEI